MSPIPHCTLGDVVPGSPTLNVFLTSPQIHLGHDLSTRPGRLGRVGNHSRVEKLPRSRQSHPVGDPLSHPLSSVNAAPIVLPIDPVHTAARAFNLLMITSTVGVLDNLLHREKGDFLISRNGVYKHALS